ncbi:MAG: hypothetical protein KAH20_01930 [Methylococcales bacterium]|nr:hypothetical protein [Methylococcales bacterium]
MLVKHIFKLLFFITCFLRFTFGSVVHAGALDPLELNEIDKAKQIQISYIRTNIPQMVVAETITGDAPDAGRISDDLEVLLVERHPIKKGEGNNTTRLADVYTYEYGSNTLHAAVINLDTNVVVSIKQNVGVQFPLTENEINKAINILTEDENVFPLVLQEYKKITGRDYTGLDQIEIKAFSFYGDSLPGVSNPESLKCGVHRCAQVVIFTPETVAFQVSPVIDLSTKKVIQNINF